ncbi:iron ascorbate-dependent oxidoreductase [Sarracenia purpurea var. burkii]
MVSKLSDAFIRHPVHHPHHKHLDLNSVKELPESHAWTTSSLDEHHPFSDDDEGGRVDQTVPVIDLDDPNARQLVGHACRTWGVFQVTNHGVDPSLLGEVETNGRALFSLPIQQKLRAARPPNGVSGYGVARFSSFFPKLMWSEGFTIFGSPLEQARLLWPQDYTKFCDVIEEYEREMKKLAGRLMWLVLGSLGITEEEDVKWAGPKDHFKGAIAAIQLNSYPSCPDPDRAMGLAAHTDSTLLTILYQSNTSGLQVFREGSGWVTVPPIPGALVVNLGDLLHILSNGLYPSVLHRAMVNRTQHRLSIAYLYGPPTNVQILPLSKLVGPSHPALYRPVTWTEYLANKAKHFDKALSSVRLCMPLSPLPTEVNDHRRGKSASCDN